MPQRRFPDKRAFGMEVLVEAESKRLVGDGAEFNEVLRAKGHSGNRRGDVYPGFEWPGERVPDSWVKTPRSYPFEPDPRERPVARVRRLLFEKPLPGVIIGMTDRQEGYLVRGSNGLLPPTRTIPLLEVALRVRSGTARVVLVHTQDVQPVPRSRRT